MSKPRTKFHVTVPGVADGDYGLTDHLSDQPDARLEFTVASELVVVDTREQAEAIRRGFPGATIEAPSSEEVVSPQVAPPAVAVGDGTPS